MKAIAIALVAANLAAVAALASTLNHQPAAAAQQADISPATFLMCDLDPNDWQCGG